MSLIQSARMNGHDPYSYLKDVLTRLPTQRASEIDICYRISGKRFSYADSDGCPHAKLQLTKFAN
jgi:hypothetical protein